MSNLPARSSTEKWNFRIVMLLHCFQDFFRNLITENKYRFRYAKMIAIHLNNVLIKLAII